MKNLFENVHINDILSLRDIEFYQKLLSMINTIQGDY